MSALTKVGASLMVVIPARIIRAFGLQSRDLVDIEIRGDEIVIRPKKRPRFSRHLLEDLLDECDLSAPRQPELIDWDTKPAVGNELI